MATMVEFAAADADEPADGGPHFGDGQLARGQQSDSCEDPRTEITRPKDVTVLNSGMS